MRHRAIALIWSAAMCLAIPHPSAAQSSTTTAQGSPVLLEAGRIVTLAIDATKEKNIPESKRAEHFALVSGLRRQIARIIPDVTTRITELQRERAQVDDKVERLESEISELSELIKKDKEDLQRELDEKSREAQRLATEFRASQDQMRTEVDEGRKRDLNEQRQILVVRLPRAQSAERTARSNLERFDQAGTRLVEAKEQLGSARTHRVYLEYDQARNLLRALNSQRDVLDDYANALLDVEKARNDFTLWATAAFSSLVGAVIVLFFAVLLFYGDVRANVFTGDAAIQFVTIFSLVIAIILFGVLRILEGKELAALLGGLSGYILGRGTISRTPSQPQTGGATSAAALTPAASHS